MTTIEKATGLSSQSAKQVLFTAMIQGFENASMPYCLLAGYDQYPQMIGSDIDFMVDASSNAALPKLLAQIAEASGSQLVQHLQHEVTASYFVLAKLINAKIIYLQPDSCSNYSRSGKLWLNAASVLKHRRYHPNGFYVPSTADAFSYYLIKKIDKKQFNAIQVDELTQRYHEDMHACRKRLYALLPQQYAQPLEIALRAKNALMSPEWKAVIDKLNAFKQALHKNAGVVIRQAYWHNLQSEIKRIILRLREPTGLRVVFLGPDGSGKSTIISAVSDELSECFRAVEYRHLRPGRLSKNTNHQVVVNPHDKPARNKIGSYVKLLYFWSQYLFGNIFWLYPRYVCSTLVIFDRYYHDLLVDPKRYRYAGNMRFAKLLGRTLEQPDLVFILDAPAEVLQSRKQEVSKMESARQRVAYQSLTQEFTHTHIISTNQPIEQAVHQVLFETLRFLELRTHQRLGLNNQVKDKLCKP